MRSKAFTVPVGPWPAGIINTLDRDSIPYASHPEVLAGLTDAVNVDFDRLGGVHARDGWSRVAESNSAGSLFFHNGITYGTIDGQVGVLTDDGFNPLFSATQARFAAIADTVLCSTPDGIRSLTGEDLFIPVTLADHEDMEPRGPMPYGEFFTVWKGRAIIAEGDTLYFSDPLSFNSCEIIGSKLVLDGEVLWMAALVSGIYINVDHTVYFLQGEPPMDLSQRVLDHKAWGGAYAYIPTADGINAEGDRVVAWFTANGFAYGTEGGGVTHPQAHNITNLPVSYGKMVYHNKRLTVIEAEEIT